ncbi:MAG TPA: MoaD/ThiS family protein [Candidatus Limnocylindrales bacterium]
MATVYLPRSLVTLFPEPPPRHMSVDSATLGQLVSDLDARWPGIADRLLEPPGPQIREHINVFINGERERDLSTPLQAGSVVHVIPAVAGG